MVNAASALAFHVELIAVVVDEITTLPIAFEDSLELAEDVWIAGRRGLNSSIQGR